MRVVAATAPARVALAGNPSAQAGALARAFEAEGCALESCEPAPGASITPG